MCEEPTHAATSHVARNFTDLDEQVLSFDHERVQDRLVLLQLGWNVHQPMVLRLDVCDPITLLQHVFAMIPAERPKAANPPQKCVQRHCRQCRVSKSGIAARMRSIGPSAENVWQTNVLVQPQIFAAFNSEFPRNFCR